MVKKSLQIESLQPAMGELERAITWVADSTGIAGKQRVVPVIQTKGKRANCLAWFAPDRWSTREGTMCHEISFSAEWLHRPVDQIIATVVHEVTHLWCHSMDVKDVSKGGRHNRRFQEHAEIMGLVCAPPETSVGYGITHAGPELLEKIEKEFVPDVAKFNLFRTELPVREKTPTKSKRWECSCEKPQVVRSSADLQITCDLCGSNLVAR